MKVFIMFAFLLGISIIPADAQNFSRFIPRGFELLDSKSGDLNQDGITDYVIICKNPNEYEDENAKRPLMILHGNPNGTLSLIARNDNIVLCFMCGGVMGDPYTGITIKNNFFSVEHAGGSSDQWTRIITFKYNIDDGNYYLSRDAGEVWNTNSKKQKKKLETYSKEQWGNALFKDYVGE